MKVDSPCRDDERGYDTWFESFVIEIFVITFLNAQNSMIKVTVQKPQNTDGDIYLCVAESIKGAIMLNPIEKLKVAILHLNRAWNH